MKQITTDFVILGAGLSGLVVAESLIKEKKDVVLIEKENQVGGLARTLSYDSFKFDIGGHRLCITKKENLAYLESLFNGNDIIYQKTKCKIYFESRFIDYPPSLKSSFSLNHRYLFKIAAELVKQKNKKSIRSFEDWIRSHYGDTLFEVYFKNYTEKVWGISCNNLSSDWADKRIGNAFSRNTREYLPNFYYPRHGIGELPEKIGQYVNNKLFKGSKIREIELFEDYGQLMFEVDNDIYRVKFKNLISTIPLRELIFLVKNAPVCLREITGDIKYRDLILACLVIDKEKLTPLHWCYIPQKDIIFSRIYEPKNWSPGLSKSRNSMMLCLEIFCSYNDNIWNTQDQLILKQVEDGLNKLNFCKGIKVLDGIIKRFTYVYPLYQVDYKECQDKVLAYFSKFRNVYLTGRSGSHSYLDMEECIIKGKETISLILNK